jgi:hypothetical protein
LPSGLIELSKAVQMNSASIQSLFIVRALWVFPEFFSIHPRGRIGLRQLPGSRRGSMLKRTVARLLLFGIPFIGSYFAARPASPVVDRPLEIPVCFSVSQGDQSRGIVIDLDSARCPVTKPQTGKARKILTLRSASSQANSGRRDRI